MNKFHKPIRMCVVCKGRFFQSELNRFGIKEGEIVCTPQDNRSFYICNDCIQKDEKTLKKSLSRFGKMGINLKEILING